MVVNEKIAQAGIHFRQKKKSSVLIWETAGAFSLGLHHVT